MRALLRRLLVISFTVCLVCGITYAQRKPNRSRRTPARQTSKPPTAQAKEDAAVAELQQLILDETAALRKKLTDAQILDTIIVIEKLWRASYIYQTTDDVQRMGVDLLTEENAKRIRRVLTTLSGTYLGERLNNYASALDDAYTLYRAYYSFSGDVSTNEVLQIARTYDLGKIPRALQIDHIMHLAEDERRLVEFYCKLAGWTPNRP